MIIKNDNDNLIQKSIKIPIAININELLNDSDDKSYDCSESITDLIESVSTSRSNNQDKKNQDKKNQDKKNQDKKNQDKKNQDKKNNPISTILTFTEKDLKLKPLDYLKGIAKIYNIPLSKFGKAKKKDLLINDILALSK